MDYGYAFCLLFRLSCLSAPARPAPRRPSARPGVSRGNETVSRGRARAARASRCGRGARAARRNCAGRTAERGAVRPSVPGALALAPALRLPARDGTSYQRTTSRDWSSGRANGYAANAALSSGTARPPRARAPRRLRRPTRTPRRTKSIKSYTLRQNLHQLANTRLVCVGPLSFHSDDPRPGPGPA